ncbi:unnamed protein product [Ambrosiozyma monospora]|uniref:Unnamed protein product n=1 Tax=Ambrosiozyma monospora TaxID=43982 RepID=A0A9W6WLI6_AMBMO|nr:unnamed protein product [Ambrosiozyma monospora]
MRGIFNLDTSQPIFGILANSLLADTGAATNFVYSSVLSKPIQFAKLLDVQTMPFKLTVKPAFGAQTVADSRALFELSIPNTPPLRAWFVVIPDDSHHKIILGKPTLSHLNYRTSPQHDYITVNGKESILPQSSRTKVDLLSIEFVTPSSSPPSTSGSSAFSSTFSSPDSSSAFSSLFSILIS